MYKIVKDTECQSTAHFYAHSGEWLQWLFLFQKIETYLQ